MGVTVATDAKHGEKYQGSFSSRGTARRGRPRARAIGLAAALATTTLVALPSGPAAAAPSAGDYCAETSPTAVDPEFFDGGDGLSSGTAFEVSTATQLAGIAADDYCLNKFFKLTKSISLSEFPEWAPIGGSAQFTGGFDGQGCTISNLQVVGDLSDRGLFGRTESATIQNLKLEDSSVQGTENIGLLVGSAVSTTLSAVSVAGSVVAVGESYDSHDGAGGVVGFSDGGAFEYLTSSAGVRVDASLEGSGAGGLLGTMVGTSLRMSYTSSTAAVNGYDHVGGLVGRALYGASIGNSYAMGSIAGANYGVGGLVGDVYGVGGPSSAISIFDSYAVAAETGEGGSFGGLVGSGGDEDPWTLAPLTYTASFWDEYTSHQSTTWLGYYVGAPDESRTTVVGASTTAEMKTASTFEAWSSSIWNIANGSYPTLKDFDAQFGTCPGDDTTPVTPVTPVVPGGGSAPAPTASATPTPSTSTAPIAPASLDPIPNNENPNIPAAGLRPGVSVVLVNGVPVPVTVAPDSNRAPRALSIVGPGFTMSLSGRSDNANPLGLTKDSALILQSQQGNRSRSGTIGTAKPGLMPFKPCKVTGPEAVTSGSGFKPGSSVKFYLLPSTYLGEMAADESGAFSGAVPIPAGITLGTHTLQVNGYSAESQVRSVSIGVIVEPTVAAKAAQARAKVFFDPMSPSITGTSAKTLDALIAKTGRQGIKTHVVGFVQESATGTNDQTLSTMRARNVASYLKGRGLTGAYIASGDGVSAISGESALGRRVNVTISYRRPC
ncbi:MAG: OmpA family protein [Actinobacteria bacterium]|nr:OmpA family protein [Actinomycetota bacterium]